MKITADDFLENTDEFECFNVFNSVFSRLREAHGKDNKQAFFQATKGSTYPIEGSVGVRDKAVIDACRKATKRE